MGEMLDYLNEKQIKNDKGEFSEYKISYFKNVNLMNILA